MPSVYLYRAHAERRPQDGDDRCEHARGRRRAAPASTTERRQGRRGAQGRKKGGADDQDARHRHLHAAVLDDDQRRSAARAGARHSGEAEREQDAEGSHARRSCSTSESGHTVADALGKHPKAFSDLYVNMVAAGEAGGILDTILDATGDVHGKERRPGPQSEGRDDLPRRHHERRVSSRSRCCCCSSFRSFETDVRDGGTGAADADADRHLGMSRFLTAYWWAVLAGDSRVGVFIQAVLRDAERQAHDRPIDAQAAGPRRRAFANQPCRASPARSAR